MRIKDFTLEDREKVRKVLLLLYPDEELTREDIELRGEVFTFFVLGIADKYYKTNKYYLKFE